MLTLPEQIVCGYWDCSEFGARTVSAKRQVMMYEIEFYLADGAFAYVDQKRYTIKKHYVLIAKPGQVRYSDLPFKTVYVKFPVAGALADLLKNVPEYFEASHPQLIYDLISEIILLRKTDQYLLLHSRLLELLNVILIDSKIPINRSGKEYETIAAAQKFIEENYRFPIHLRDIAQSVHLSEIYFHRIFTEAIGISPHQYLINCRIAAAKQLLLDTENSLSYVAETLGFGCQQYFNKVFKKETGMTPSQYRKSVQQNYLV